MSSWPFRQRTIQIGTPSKLPPFLGLNTERRSRRGYLENPGLAKAVGRLVLRRLRLALRTRLGKATTGPHVSTDMWSGLENSLLLPSMGHCEIGPSIS